MQALSKAAAGKSYTIKWMFGIPEVWMRSENARLMKAVRSQSFRIPEET